MVAVEVQQRAREHQHLVALGKLAVVGAARELAVHLLERHALLLGVGDARLELGDARLRLLERRLRLRERNARLRGFRAQLGEPAAGAGLHRAHAAPCHPRQPRRDGARGECHHRQRASRRIGRAPGARHGPDRGWKGGVAHAARPSGESASSRPGTPWWATTTRAKRFASPGAAIASCGTTTVVAARGPKASLPIIATKFSKVSALSALTACTSPRRSASRTGPASSVVRARR